MYKSEIIKEYELKPNQIHSAIHDGLVNYQLIQNPTKRCMTSTIVKVSDVVSNLEKIKKYTKKPKKKNRVPSPNKVTCLYRTATCTVESRADGIIKLEKYLKKYRNQFVPKIQSKVDEAIQDESGELPSMLKDSSKKEIEDYIENINYRPVPFRDQMIKIEKIQGQKYPKYYLYINVGTREKKDEIVLPLKLPTDKKQRKWIDKASGGDYRGDNTNKHLRWARVIQDNRYGRYNVHITVALDKPEEYNPKGWIGVDVGWKKLATSMYCDNSGDKKNHDVHGKKFKSKVINLKKLLKEHQRKGTTKKWRNRLENYTDYVAGKIAREIVEKARKHGAGVSLEDLNFPSHKREFLIPRYKINQKVQYQCEYKGVPLKTVDPRYTTKRCNKCGYVDENNINEENDRRFNCLECGYEADRDINAAMNIGDAAIGTGLAPVPNSPTRTGSE